MCGISAYFLLNHRADPIANADENTDKTTWTQRLDRSVESMRHRGPDNKGVWIAPCNRAGLAHVRLSTRDLSNAGRQPLHGGDNDNNIHAIVNGELYYDEEPRRRLGDQYAFQSTCDSEMVIALYRAFGDSFVRHLRGEFSLVVYDAEQGKLVAARDRFGVKPLHYSIVDGQLLIATQAKGIVELLDNRQPLRWDAYCFAQGGGHYGLRTLFEGIRRFPPGHFLIARHDQTDAPEFQPYWETRYPANCGDCDDRPTEELVETLRAHLLEAVRMRVESSDVPVGVLLSGGVDSSAVAGIAAHVTRRKAEESGQDQQLPTCFTIGFPDDDDVDESAVATRTAKHLGLPIEKVVITEQMLADEFEEACWLGEALMWDLQHIAKKILSRHISSRGLKVVLNGDGSDELFGGYPFFAADRLLADDQRRAKSLQNASPAQREQLLQQQQHANTLKWFGSEEAGGTHHHDPSALALGLPPAFSNWAVSRHDAWLPKSVRNLSTPFAAIAELFSPAEAAAMPAYHPLHRGMAGWIKSILPNMVIAAISDGAEMAHSVESRPPFLDHVVAEFAQTLPADVPVHVDPGAEEPVLEKWLFRRAVRPFVTDEVFRKRKQAFAAPFRYAVGGPLYEKLASLITRENVEALGLAEWTACEGMLDRAFEAKDQLLFRQVIWLAQIVSVGLQFDVKPWRIPTDGEEEEASSVPHAHERRDVEREVKDTADWLPQSFL